MAAGWVAVVTVSPERAPPTSLIPAMRYPTSPGPSSSTGTVTGVRMPISSISWLSPACMNRSRSLVVSVPSMTLIELTTPRYWS